MFCNMKMHKSSIDPRGNKLQEDNALCLRDGEEGHKTLVGDIGQTVGGPHSPLSKKLLRLAVPSMAQPTRSRRTERRTPWVIWVPESVLLRSKMIYASSKDAIQKLTGVSKNYKQAERRSRPTPLLSPWNASLCDQPPAPCLKHPLAQTCPPSGTCRLSSQTGEAWEDSSRKRAVPLSHLPEQSSPAPGLFASVIPDGSSLPQTTFDLLIPLG